MGTRAGLLAGARRLCDGQRTMGDREARIGSALRRMAEDLVEAQRRVAVLERENRRLRARLETLERPEERLQSSGSPTEKASRT